MSTVKKQNPYLLLLDYLTKEKKPWEKLTKEEQKTFEAFMINKYLSMDLYFIEVINQLQFLSNSIPKEMVWRLYLEVLPKERYFNKFIKSEKKETDKEIESVKKFFNCNEEIAETYITLLKRKDKKKLEEIINNFN